MANKVKLYTIKTKLDNLDYWRFARDFQNLENQLQTVFWNCIALDVIQNKLSYDSESQFQDFANRLHKSFLGCFYKAHELHQYLLTQFDGLHKVYRFEEPYRSQRNEWEENLNSQQAESIILILHSIKEQFNSSELIQPNINTDLINLKSFEKFQEYLGQSPYISFLSHLEFTHYGKSVNPPSKINQLFDFNASFIANLQDYAITFIKARTIKFTLNRVDALFNSSNNRISAYQKANPKKAVIDLLLEFPVYKQLTDSQIAHICKLNYRDENGNELKLNSLMSVLKQLRSSNTEIFG